MLFQKRHHSANCRQLSKEQNCSYLQNYPYLGVIFAFHHTLFNDITLEESAYDLLLFSKRKKTA